ncbi:MAG: hypothetical protein ACRERE_36295 [Candidatus Entotheonellia bacterium]
MKTRKPIHCSIAITRLAGALVLLGDQHTHADTRPMTLKVQASWPSGIIPYDNLRTFADRQRIAGTGLTAMTSRRRSVSYGRTCKAYAGHYAPHRQRF